MLNYINPTYFDLKHFIYNEKADIFFFIFWHFL